MIHSELPQPRPKTYRTMKKRYTSVITPDKILLNEKLMLGLMFTGIVMILIKWTVKKG